MAVFQSGLRAGVLDRRGGCDRAGTWLSALIYRSPMPTHLLRASAQPRAREGGSEGVGWRARLADGTIKGRRYRAGLTGRRRVLFRARL